MTQDLARDAVKDPLVIVANRGPVEYTCSDDGERVAERGSGRLVTALAGLVGHFDGAVWICAAMSDEDRVVAREHAGKAFDLDGDGPQVRMVPARAPPAARRPGRPEQEHPPRLPGLRHLARRPLGARREGDVPGVGAAQPGGRFPVRRLPGEDPQAGGRHQPEARDRRLAAHRPRPEGRLRQGAGCLQAVRRAGRERRVRRDEPRGQGIRAAERTQRRAGPVREHRCVRGAGRVRRHVASVRHPAAGRLVARRAHDGCRRAPHAIGGVRRRRARERHRQVAQRPTARRAEVQRPGRRNCLPATAKGGTGRSRPQSHGRRPAGTSGRWGACAPRRPRSCCRARSPLGPRSSSCPGRR